MLNQIAALANSRLVIVSGRPGQRGASVVGTRSPVRDLGPYGWERLWPDGGYQMMLPPEWARQSLEFAYGRLLALACGRLRGMLAIERQMMLKRPRARAIPNPRRGIRQC
ncbi:MAG: hypothetical protein ACREVK_13175 [Gammaproteobacteria bacterium]